MLVTVIDAGGIHAAARQLGRSHSAVSAAMTKLQQTLNLDLLTIEGRRCVPTDAGTIMARRAHELLRRAQRLEALADALDAGWEPQLNIAVDGLVPPRHIAEILKRFEPHARGTRLHIVHVVKSGAAAAALDPSFDLVFTASLPPKTPPQPLLEIAFAPVVSAAHPMANMLWSEDQLTDALQIVVADTGPRHPHDEGWLRSERRWTVADFYTAKQLLASDMAFAIMPLPWIEDELRHGQLRRIAPAHRDLQLTVHLVLPKRERLGPGGRRLEQLINAFYRP